MPVDALNRLAGLDGTRTVVHIAAPLPQQLPIVHSPARFKIVRAGRRFGKTRLALYCALIGHGPDQCFPGIVSGISR